MELPQLDRGTRGDLVRSWQLFLRSQGIKMDFSSNAGDGIFGPGTVRGTQEYQSRHGLKVTGIVDSETYDIAVQQGFVLSAG